MLQFKKSREPDLLNYTIIHKLDLLLKEQVEQRKDLSIINALIKTGHADAGVRAQVDEFFERDETSPQTELEDK